VARDLAEGVAAAPAPPPARPPNMIVTVSVRRDVPKTVTIMSLIFTVQQE